WGTFTSFSGPSGDLVPYSIHLGSDLPPFVLGRTVDGTWDSADSVQLAKFWFAAEQRMETPVIYFYSDKPLNVGVEVRFPRGLVTEVYPPFSGAAPLHLDGYVVPEGGSAVRWDHVQIVPKASSGAMTFADAGKSHYSAARATDADVIRVEQGGNEYAERFLFY